MQKVIYEASETNKSRMYSGREAAHAAPVSVADELAKLDRLRADGVLTEEESGAGGPAVGGG